MTKRLLIICLIASASNVAHAASASLRAGVGVLERSGGPDLMPRIGVAARLQNGLQLHLQLGAIFTNEKGADGANNGNHVYEWQALIGPGWRFAATEGLYIDGAIIAGALFRQYPDHEHTVGAFEVPLTFGIRLVEGLAVELRVAPGWEKSGTDPGVGTTPAWHRGHLLLEAGALLAYDFDPYAGAHKPVDF